MSNRQRYLLSALLILLILFADQYIKYIVKTGMLLHERISVTPWFQIFFTENRGMAFGMDFVGTTLLTMLRLVAIVAFAVYLGRLIRKNASTGLVVCISMIIAGAAGNVIDNCFYGLVFTDSLPADSILATPAKLVPFGTGYGGFLAGKVVDMFYFPLFTWPDWVPFLGGEVFFNAVFNFADACISCATVTLLLFYRKDLAALFVDSEKVTEVE